MMNSDMGTQHFKTISDNPQDAQTIVRAFWLSSRCSCHQCRRQVSEQNRFLFLPGVCFRTLPH